MGTTSSGRRKPAPQVAAALRTMKSPSLATSRSGAYNTGLSEPDVERKAVEDGQAGVLDPTVVGVNSHPHAVDGLVDGHDAATGVIAHDARGDIDAVDGDLEEQRLKFAADLAAALHANSAYEAVERHRILQLARMKAKGLPIPSRWGFFLLVAALVGLFVGDWGLITLGYQVLGLSDRPWIPGLAFTDDLHLAAFSSVFALVVLGDGVGDRLRRIEQALNDRRIANETDRDRLSKPAPFDFVWLAVCLLGALAGLAALSHIRSEYLAALGSDAGGLAFFSIQLVILLAAIALGFHHANPEAKNWATADKKATAAEAKRDTAIETLNTTGSRINAAIDHRDAILASSGHHVNTDAANARIQAAAYKRRYLLSQLEPAQEQLFAEHKAPREYAAGELLARITGITPLPEFEKVSTQPVMDALEQTRIKLDVLRARIDQIEINKLNLPDLEDEILLGTASDDETDPQNSAQTAAERPLHPVLETEPVAGDDTTEDVA
ncbi:hypothetical protein [Nocardioides sp. T2.26MG-1]|uniref:hypothetical protein n=1 Tax=Nocardioides sp. T2.26MG-1 TaxID=3041166 RepID=UPI002477C60B|nr:hypothetical protein [Nocardioides sp. T2.26MG-1]CAI9413172.1 hypothetical protein HIDPHFAB_01954 [Nocardioides sp. T2.26MG-1]